MNILKLELTHFGKFHLKTITFTSGLNIVYGKNEAGKSTIHAFVRSMLFGIPDTEEGNERYSHYLPWETPHDFCGRMWIKKDDNEYYLKHSFKKESNISGTVFVDYRNNIDEDRNLILYGHNMRNGTMFNNLTNFKEESFFNNNNIINIVRNNILYQYEVFSVYVEDESKVNIETEFIDNEAFASYVLNEGSKSMFNKDIEISNEDKIITLVTCSYEYTGARTILVAKLKNITER